MNRNLPGSRRRHRSQCGKRKTAFPVNIVQLDLGSKFAPYHLDGCAEGSLVVVDDLEAGELAETATGAQSPTSIGRGASSKRHKVAGCGVGSSGRMCQGGHRPHRGSGGRGIHLVPVYASNCVTSPVRVPNGLIEWRWTRVWGQNATFINSEQERRKEETIEHRVAKPTLPGIGITIPKRWSDLPWAVTVVTFRHVGNILYCMVITLALIRSSLMFI